MFFKKYYRKRKILNPKNLVLSRSTPVSSYNSINANQRQISRTRTDQYNSKLSKVIQFEKKQSLNFLIFEKICKRIIKKKKTIFLVYSGPLKVNFRLYIRLLTSQCFFLTLITVSIICCIIFQYLPSLFFHCFAFCFTFFFLICSPRDTFYNLATMFNSISLQPALDYSISLQCIIQKIFTKLQTTFQNVRRNDEKGLL